LIIDIDYGPLLEQPIDLILGASQESWRRRGCGPTSGEDAFERLREVVNGHLHPQPDESERGAIVEEHDEDDAAGDIGEVHGLLLALMEQHAEVTLADAP
jgi:hypothetical protein